MQLKQVKMYKDSVWEETQWGWMLQEPSLKHWEQGLSLRYNAVVVPVRTILDLRLTIVGCSGGRVVSMSAFHQCRPAGDLILVL